MGPIPAATAEETECLLRWLDTPGLRVVRGTWQAPLATGARHLERLIDLASRAKATTLTS